MDKVSKVYARGMVLHRNKERRIRYFWRSRGAETSIETASRAASDGKRENCERGHANIEARRFHGMIHHTLADQINEELRDRSDTCDQSPPALGCRARQYNCCAACSTRENATFIDATLPTRDTGTTHVRNSSLHIGITSPVLERISCSKKLDRIPEDVQRHVGLGRRPTLPWTDDNLGSPRRKFMMT